MVKHFGQQRSDKQTILNEIKSIDSEIMTLDEHRDNFTPDDIKLENYTYHPSIKMEVSV
jgi:thymidylate synthase